MGLGRGFESRHLHHFFGRHMNLEKFSKANFQETQYRARANSTIYLDVGKRITLRFEQAQDEHLAGLSLMRQEHLAQTGVLAKKQDSEQFAKELATFLSEELSKRNLKDLAAALEQAAAF